MKKQPSSEKTSTPIEAPSEDKARRSSRALRGFLVRKEGWRLSWWGRLLVVAGIGIAVLVMFRGGYRFLAINKPVAAECVVVEGWIDGYALKQAAGMCNTGGYRRVFTSGGVRLDFYAGVPKRTYAEMAASELARFGLTNGAAQAIPCGLEGKDRTYSSALAVKEWLRQNEPSVKSIDIITLGAHARRTRLLFQKALGPDIKVGVISIQTRNYDTAHWWRSSSGVRDVLTEGIGYLYSRFLFHPADPERND
jgi:uncharacterized SAM-binding protein YcdF (DUF218 family)